MKAIQIMVDEKLLSRLDRAARRGHLSRSAFIRNSVEVALSAGQLQALVEAERKAYQDKPQTADERAAYRALSASQARVLRELTDEETW